MKVLISGYYGFGNVGDESVLKAIIKGLREIDSKINITVLSATPKITREFTGVRCVNRNNPLKILTNMIKSKYFISGGGSLFQNVTSSRSLYYYLGLIVLAKLLFRKVVVFAQGFGPLNGRINRFITKFVLNRANLITLRDADSYEELKQLGVKRPKVQVTADPTFILDIPAKELGKKVLSLEAVRMNRPLVGIAVRSVPQQEEEKLYKSLSEAIDWLVKDHDHAPVFVLFGNPEDMGETSKVINFMLEKSNIIFKICRPDEMMSIIANFDLLIGLRLHSLIFAAISQVPMLGLAYDPKVEAFMKTIEQPYLMIDEHLSFKRLRDALEWIINNKQKVRISLKQKDKDLREQAKQSFSLFKEKFNL